MKWNVGTLDLDWHAQNPAANPANGYENLADILDEGGEVLAVWWEPRGEGFARVLYRVPVKAEVRG